MDSRIISAAKNLSSLFVSVSFVKYLGPCEESEISSVTNIDQIHYVARNISEVLNCLAYTQI
jgi:hypothetical protein